MADVEDLVWGTRDELVGYLAADIPGVKVLGWHDDGDRFVWAAIRREDGFRCIVVYRVFAVAGGWDYLGTNEGDGITVPGCPFRLLNLACLEPENATAAAWRNMLVNRHRDPVLARAWLALRAAHNVLIQFVDYQNGRLRVPVEESLAEMVERLDT